MICTAGFTAYAYRPAVPDKDRREQGCSRNGMSVCKDINLSAIMNFRVRSNASAGFNGVCQIIETIAAVFVVTEHFDIRIKVLGLPQDWLLTLDDYAVESSPLTGHRRIRKIRENLHKDIVASASVVAYVNN